MSLLEAVGCVKYEATDSGSVMVIQLGLYMNLKGRTIEEMHATRKDLHFSCFTYQIQGVREALREWIETAKQEQEPEVVATWQSVREKALAELGAVIKKQFEGESAWFVDELNSHVPVEGRVRAVLPGRGLGHGEGSRDRMTARFYPAPNDDAECVRALLEVGAAMETALEEWDGWTALECAQSMAALLELGADLDASNSTGDTARSLVEAGGHADCVELLSAS